MDYQELFNFLKNAGKDPFSLVFEDELTGLHNRRFLLNYFQYKIPWEEPDYHVSLLMIDIDHFKKVNDTYGHDAGDKALVHVAGILKQACTETGMPIRYAGDEFMVLLAGKVKEAALELGESLIQAMRQRPVSLKEGEREAFLTLSIGVAGAPEDAENGAVLVQKADTALYHAKQAGRDRVSDAAKAPPQEVFPKIAVQSLETLKMAGRQAQLAQFRNALEGFNRQLSRFLVIEGADGMGKSAFLRGVQGSLESAAVTRVRVFGSPQELFRPYYLVSNIIVELLNGREDKGRSVLEGLAPDEIEAISFVLPSLAGGRGPVPDDLKKHRELIFRALMRLIKELVESDPLAVFVDDLHFADEASLQLLRAIMMQKSFPLFVCGTASDILQPAMEINPLQSFRQAYGKQLDLQKIVLTPLSEGDIAEHLEKMFPAIARPAGFEKEVFHVTRGNPLFVSEILSKLVHDRKIIFADRGWMIPKLDPAYLSASLDEVVTEMISSLDEDSKRILNYASVFGESVSLSMLTGSSGDMETRVLDFLDKAKSYGLVISDFRADDENIRFLSKRIQKIVYGGMEQGLKEDLHEKIALYHEKLFEKSLLPSAAILAWHFQRSANTGKASLYDEQHREFGARVFQQGEALQYSMDAETAAPEIPLDPASLKDVWSFFRSFLIAVNGVRLYPAGNAARTNALVQVRNILGRILEGRDRIRVTAEKDSLSVNGEALETADFRSVAQSICEMFAGIDLGSLSIKRGFSEKELENMLEAIGRADHRKIHPQFWERLCEERGLESIELKQVRYTRVEEKDGSQGPSEEGAIPDAQAVAAPLGQALSKEELGFVPLVITAIMGAHSKRKLYPAESAVMTDAMEQVTAALSGFFSRCPVLNMTVVDSSLLVNGVKVDTHDFQPFATGFLALLESASLSSVTFVNTVSPGEVASFLSTLVQQPAAEMSADFWRALERNKTFRGILFNHSVYTVFEERPTGLAEPAAAEAEGSHAGEEHDAPIAAAVDDHKGPAEDLALALKDLALREEEQVFTLLLKRIFGDYASQSTPGREALVETCGKVAAPGNFVLSPRYLKLIAAQLAGVWRREQEARVLELLAGLLQQIALAFLQFGEYPLAGWIFAALKERVGEIGDSPEGLRERLRQVLQEPFPPQALSAAREELKSTDPVRRQQALQFISTMDERVLPFLLDILKDEDDPQLRQLSAALFEKMGPAASEFFKGELVLEISAEEQVRLLDVADLVTRDIHVELGHFLNAENPLVRRAAFRLAERLNDEQTVDMLCEIVRSDAAGRVVPAIRSLGRMKAPQCVPVLVSAINGAREQEVQTAGCQALGQIADPAGMDILIRILTQRILLTTQKRYSDNIRAVAAFALSQIPDPKVAEVMKTLADDSNQLVRQSARAVLARGVAEKSGES